MAPPRSVHDNLVLSYNVDGYNRRITLTTICRETQPHEYTSIVFNDVLAYDFRGDSMGTILFDVHEVSLEQVYDDHQETFEAQKSRGWLPFRYESREDVLAELGTRNVKAFSLWSSIGMTGFVIAGEMHFFPLTRLPITHYLPTAFCLMWFDSETEKPHGDALLHGVTENEVRRWVGLPESDEPWEYGDFILSPESVAEITQRFGLEAYTDCIYTLGLCSINEPGFTPPA